MLMGICGLIWTGFVFVHMAGNMLILVGAEAYNKYSHAIVSNKIVLYGAEIVLLLALIGHATLGILLTAENYKAAPKKYAMKASPQKRATLASQTMAIHGTIILFFIIYHLITFKYGAEYTVEYDGVVMRDLYKLIFEVFSQPAYVFGYVICLLLLGTHLSHGFGSVFQTLGLNHPKYNKLVKCGSYVYAAVVVAGFISQPIYVFWMTL
jgi:succinate dehydrogenase / fumarate reductase cytochrome b subunit